MSSPRTMIPTGPMFLSLIRRRYPRCWRAVKKLEIALRFALDVLEQKARQFVE